MGDKSPKSNQRKQSQKKVAKGAVAAQAKAKQVSQGRPEKAPTGKK